MNSVGPLLIARSVLLKGQILLRPSFFPQILQVLVRVRIVAGVLVPGRGGQREGEGRDAATQASDTKLFVWE